MHCSPLVLLGWSQLGCWHSEELTLLYTFWSARLGTRVSSVTHFVPAGTVMEQEPKLGLPLC